MPAERRVSKPWFSLHLNRHTFPGTPTEGLFGRLVEQARTAEDAGFSQVTVMDHLYQIPMVGASDEPMLEAWSTLNALARETTRVRLGPQVMGVTYRNPALVAKMATTLDVTSGGRALMGIGAAWHDEEHVGYGYDFPTVRERMDRLDEALTIIRAMFSQDRPSFSGRYYRIESAWNVPRPIQPGGPRIMVGGGGEQRTLRIAARHADITHWLPLGLDVMKHKTELVFRYCDEIGRDPTTIERTMATPVFVGASAAQAEEFSAQLSPERRRGIEPVASPEAAAEALQPYIKAGFTGFTFNNAHYRTADAISRVGEVLRLIGG